MSTPNSGYIYVIDCGDCVKVGCSATPQRRIKTLSKTLGLINPKLYVSAKCYKHYDYEKVIHCELGNKRKSGEFFNVSFTDAVKVIDNTVIKITPEQELSIIVHESNASDKIKEMADSFFTPAHKPQEEYQKNLDSKIIISDAIRWCDSFGLDFTDKLQSCGDNVTSALCVSLEIHKEVIAKYAESLNN